jgi:hypothetical protein
MLATGIELQTLAQISQLLAMNLDLHKSQMQTELAKQQKKDAYLQLALTGKFPKNGQPPARFIARNTKERSLK